MSVSPDMIHKVAIWRDKARRNELTQDEMREAITFLRQERMAMPPPSTRSAKPQVNGDDLLKELGI